jgi:hypothetical protein
VSVSENTPLQPVSPSYLGFSIEGGNICYILSMAQSNPAFVQLFKNLGSGVMRIGGSSSGGASTWSTTGTASCKRRAMVVTPTLVDQFFTFAQSVGFKVMWEIPLSDDASQQRLVAQEAAYVATKSDLFSIEFGNEPDGQPSSDYSTLIADWNDTYQDYLSDGGNAPVTGPATNESEPAYLQQFLPQDVSHLAGITEHYYGGTAASDPTCTSLLQLKGMSKFLTTAVAAAQSYKLPLIVNETSTYTGPPTGSTKGAPGVSNAYCSSLWAASYLLMGLQDGAAGVDFHGTANYAPGNSGGLPEDYTPINENGTPAPLYYGMLFYRDMTMAGGSAVGATASSGTAVNAYAVRGADGKLRVALVNLTTSAQTVSVTTQGTYANAFSITLQAPALDSLSGVTLGGAAVASDGTWTQKTRAVVPSAPITVPADQAVIVTYRSR